MSDDAKTSDSDDLLPVDEELVLDEGSPSQVNLGADASLSDVTLGELSDEEIPAADSVSPEAVDETDFDLSLLEEDQPPGSKEAAKSTPVEKKPAAEKKEQPKKESSAAKSPKVESRAESSAELIERLGAAFDFKLDIASTARQHVETAYAKLTDPSDKEQRNSAKAKLRSSLLTFCEKALEKGILDESTVQELFTMASTFANTLLVTRSKA